jgi:hypothetical protein
LHICELCLFGSYRWFPMVFYTWFLRAENSSFTISYDSLWLVFTTEQSKILWSYYVPYYSNHWPKFETFYLVRKLHVVLFVSSILNLKSGWFIAFPLHARQIFTLVFIYYSSFIVKTFLHSPLLVSFMGKRAANSCQPNGLTHNFSCQPNAKFRCIF